MKPSDAVKAFCRKWCTAELAWNDRKRAECRRDTPCDDIFEERERLKQKGEKK